MIRAEGLCKQFDGILAVDDLTLEIAPGEVFGFLGPNGAGKTTTVRMLTSLITPTAGTAWINGYQIGVEDDGVRASAGILTETPGLYPRLNAEQNLRLYGKVYEIDDVESQVKRYLTMLGLWDRRHEPVGGFSKGMRQKLAIARALLHEPPVLFLDEPTSALDPEAARTVRTFIEGLSGQGRTIFICTHNLDEADRLCDRIGIIKQYLIRVDTPDALRRRLYGESVLVHLRQVTSDLVSITRRLAFVKTVSQQDNCLRVVLSDPQRENPALVRALVEAGGDVQFVEEERQSLEQVYFDLVGELGEAP